MMEFEFANHPHISLRRFVWYNNICIGYIDQKIREYDNIDWPSLRADKTKVLKSKDRWYSLFSGHAYPNILVPGQFKDPELAASAILKKHFENAPGSNNVRKMEFMET